MAKEKYMVDYDEVEGIENFILIEAGVRYLNSEEFPRLDVFASILGIKKESVCDTEEDCDGR